MSEYKWQGEYDDITCRIDNQILRVEQMDTMRWWWLVVMDDKTIGSGIKNSKQEAKELAEVIATFANNVKVVSKHHPKVE